MNRRCIQCWCRKPVVICMVFCLSTPALAATLLKAGAKGGEVWDLQISLLQLGFLQIAPSGVFDNHTLEAVRQFQVSQGLTVDGAVGNQTWRQLELSKSRVATKVHVVTSGDTLWSLARSYGINVETLARANRLRDADRLKPGQKLVIPLPVETSGGLVKVTPPATSVPAPGPGVAAQAREARARLVPQMLSWTEVQQLFPPNTVARVVDVETGRSFRVRRYYGHLHADVEPLTAEDTAMLKSLYGGRWSWERRPVIVEVADKRIAASINGYPHGNGSSKANGFGGHFCVHFLGSRVHRTGRSDPDHQAAVRAAANAFSGAVVIAE